MKRFNSVFNYIEPLNEKEYYEVSWKNAEIMLFMSMRLFSDTI